MSDPNKHGLSRTIPAAVKRAVRQRCGFGCVICGGVFIDYDHFDPEFSEATEHDENGITLLCLDHHGRKSRNFLSRGAVVQANAAPFCKSQGFSFGEMEASRTHPYVIFAGSAFVNVNVPVEVEGIPLIRIDEPESPGGPYRLSANFFDSHENLALQIVENECRISSSQWDAEATGGRMIIRSAPGKISLQIQFVPGQGIVVERLDMFLKGCHFVGNPSQLRLTRSDGSTVLMANNRVTLAYGGFQFTCTVPQPVPSDWKSPKRLEHERIQREEEEARGERVARKIAGSGTEGLEGGQ